MGFIIDADLIAGGELFPSSGLHFTVNADLTALNSQLRLATGPDHSHRFEKIIQTDDRPDRWFDTTFGLIGWVRIHGKVS